MTNALSRRPNHAPVLTVDINKSRTKALYAVNTNINVTIVLNFEGKSCRDHNQTRDAVTICCI